MEFYQWVSVLVPSIISIIGFIVTIAAMNLQFRNEKKEKIINEQRKLYVDCYLVIEEILRDKYLVFDRNYLDKVNEFDGKMELMASNKVLNEYRNYVLVITLNVCKFEKFYDNLKKDLEYQVDDEGNQIIISDEEWQLELERQSELFMKKEFSPDLRLHSRVDYILDAMRADLGNDKKKPLTKILDHYRYLNPETVWKHLKWKIYIIHAVLIILPIVGIILLLQYLLR